MAARRMIARTEPIRRPRHARMRTGRQSGTTVSPGKSCRVTDSK